MGSVVNTENNNLYYLSRTTTLPNVPLKILDNIRKTTDYNKKMGKEMSDLILQKFNVLPEHKTEKDVLIIDRKNSRKLKNLRVLCNYLDNNNFNYEIVIMEDLNLSEQIKLIRSYKNIICGCGSVQVHISFLREGSKWIELSEPGFRYPNTSVYGNRFNIKTYMLCTPLKDNLSYLKKSK